MTTPPAAPTADELRNQLVDSLLTYRKMSPAVEEAMRTVPREAHLPGVRLKKAYANEAITIKDNPTGPQPLSCASVPSVVALMLEQLDIHPGDHIQEIGAGTGYNAALLAHLTGPTGEVTTIDIDADVTAHARTALDATGHHRIHVVTRDGAEGAPEYAPYQRMTATVGVWDIPGPWWEQLTDGGRLVLPLRWRGQTRSVAFTRHGDRMVSDSVELCGFVPMIGQDGEKQGSVDKDGHITLYWDADQPINPAALSGLTDAPFTAVWTDATVGGEESFDGIWLRLTATDPATCRIETKPEAVEAGLRRPAIPSRTPALVEGDSMAYLILDRVTQPGAPLHRLGAIGYGPAGEDLARRLCAQITAWSLQRAARPTITAYPAGTSDDQLTEGFVIDKPSVRLALAYP